MVRKFVRKGGRSSPIVGEPIKQKNPSPPPPVPPIERETEPSYTPPPLPEPISTEPKYTKEQQKLIDRQLSKRQRGPKVGDIRLKSITEGPKDAPDIGYDPGLLSGETQITDMKGVRGAQRGAVHQLQLLDAQTKIAETQKWIDSVPDKIKTSYDQLNEVRDYHNTYGEKYDEWLLEEHEIVYDDWIGSMEKYIDDLGQSMTDSSVYISNIENRVTSIGGFQDDLDKYATELALAEERQWSKQYEQSSDIDVGDDAPAGIGVATQYEYGGTKPAQGPEWIFRGVTYTNQSDANQAALEYNTANARGISLSKFKSYSKDYQNTLIAQTGAGAGGVKFVTPEGSITTYGFVFDGKEYISDSRSEAQQQINNLQTASALGVSIDTFMSYSKRKRDALSAQRLPPMKFTVNYIDENGNAVTKMFNQHIDAINFSKDKTVENAATELQKEQDNVRRQKRSLIAGLFGISTVMSAGELWSSLTTPEAQEQTFEDIQRTTDMVVSGAVEAFPIITLTTALGVGALVVGGPLLSGLYFGGLAVGSLGSLYKNFGTSRSRREFNNWAKNNPQEAYDTLLKTTGAMVLGYYASLGTSIGIQKIKQYQLDKFYKDFPLDDWESWYVKEEVMGFYPEETTRTQIVTEQIMARQTEFAGKGPIDWVQKWVDNAKIKNRKVLSGDLILTEGMGDSLETLDYAGMVADQTLLPLDLRTGKVVYKPQDITHYLTFLSNNPAFRVQLERLAAGGVYIPGWMGITGVKLLTDTQYKDMLSRGISIIMSDDGKLAYYTITDVIQDLSIGTLPDLTPAQLDTIENMLTEPNFLETLRPPEAVPKFELDLYQTPDIIPISYPPQFEPELVDPVPIAITTPIEIVPIPIPIVTPNIPTPRLLREGRLTPKGAHGFLGKGRHRREMRDRKRANRIKPSRNKEPYKVTFRYSTGEVKIEDVDARGFHEALVTAQKLNEIKLIPMEVEVERL